MNKNIEDLNNVIADAIDGSEETRNSADKLLAKQQREALDLLAVITSGREEIEQINLIQEESNKQRTILKGRMELELELAFDAIKELKEITQTTEQTELAKKLRALCNQASSNLVFLKMELG